MDTIENTLVNLTSKYSDANPVHLDLNLKTDLGLDSLSLTELIVACEDEFSIEIDMDHPDTINAKTLRDLYNGVVLLVDSN
jgi:acyl carrier protein